MLPKRQAPSQKVKHPQRGRPTEPSHLGWVKASRIILPEGRASTDPAPLLKSWAQKRTKKCPDNKDGEENLSRALAPIYLAEPFFSLAGII